MLKLFVLDLAVIVVAVAGSQLFWFGIDGADLPLTRRSSVAIGYVAVSAILVTAWMIVLSLALTRDHRIIGSGAAEYKRVADGTFALFGFFAVVAYLLKIDLARGYLLTALPLGLFLLVLTRWLWRQGLHRARARGEALSKVVLVGSRVKVEHVARSIQRERSAGLIVVAVVLPDGSPLEEVAGVPVAGGLNDVLSVLDRTGASTVVLAGSDHLSHNAVRVLSWNLEARGAELIVVPEFTDVAGPRIHARPVAGLPLIHIDFPKFAGMQHIIKRIFDVVISSFALLVLLPFMLVIAIFIKADSPGAAIFMQERVGLNGISFRMFKFRTMNSSAEAELSSVLDLTEGNAVLFKMKKDPRITRIGGVLRRYSLDEVPQLINVLAGHMSLVGPRPPLLAEVERYDSATRRRLLVKPGITGLWQVSGRSDLSWDDSIRLDLYYVENWSLTGDFVLIYRTFRAVIRAQGAY